MSGLNAIADDPVIRCMERTGYPPWMRHHEPDEDDDEDYCGEAFDAYWGSRPMAVYDPE